MSDTEGYEVEKFLSVHIQRTGWGSRYVEVIQAVRRTTSASPSVVAKIDPME